MTLIIVWFIATTSSWGCGQDAPKKPTVSPDKAPPIAVQIESFCGKCHAYPKPESFTWSTWKYAIQYMYRFMKEHYPQDLNVVSQSDVEAHYRRHAATELPWPKTYPTLSTNQGPTFEWTSISTRAKASIVSHLETAAKTVSSVVMTNAISGDVSLINLKTPKPAINPLFNVKHPSRTATGDVDGDGQLDYVVAELGTFTAKDTQLGQVRIWRRRNGGQRLETILPTRGRVADVKIRDIDGDGRPDILIAEFGWHATGGVHVLWNGGTDSDGRLRLSHQILSTTPGAISIDAGDMNGDGRVDVVVNYAQHFERIDVLYRDTKRTFRTQTVFAAPTPLWGSLAIGVVDLDGDGLLDIVHANGDALDVPKLAIFQGIHWFKNTKNGGFKPHQLAELPGAHGLTWGDYDGDGRLDLVGISNLPNGIEKTRPPVRSATTPKRVLDAVILIKQTEIGQFQAYSLRQNDTCFSAVASGDWDRDGDVDIALGAFGMGWTLLGQHDGLPKGPSEKICADGQVYLLKNQGTGAYGLDMNPRPLSLREHMKQRLDALTTIVTNDDQDARNRVNLGSILTQMGQLPLAIQRLQEAISIDPKLTGAHLNLAIALERAQRLAEAHKAIKAELAISPNSGDAHNQLAIILFRQKKPNQAILQAQKAIRIDPKSIPYRENLGTFYAVTQQYDAARKVFAQILDMHPNHAGASQALKRLKALER